MIDDSIVNRVLVTVALRELLRVSLVGGHTLFIQNGNHKYKEISKTKKYIYIFTTGIFIFFILYIYIYNFFYLFKLCHVQGKNNTQYEMVRAGSCWTATSETRAQGHWNRWFPFRFHPMI